jgi:hypothetical protein
VIDNLINVIYFVKKLNHTKNNNQHIPCMFLFPEYVVVFGADALLVDERIFRLNIYNIL